MSENTIPEVFIVESLRPNDPREGEIIYKILKMGERSPKYRYVHTPNEFRSVILLTYIKPWFARMFWI